MSDEPVIRDAGYDEWLDALGDGAGYYLACPEGHGSLPPRRVCPECGSTDLSEDPIPAEGRVAAFTVVHVASPQFADDTPYVTAVADFGPVALTGLLRVDPDAAAHGTTVEVRVGRTETTGDRVVVFDPV